MASIPPPTAEESAVLKNWAAALKKLKRKGGPRPEEYYLLGSPCAYRLAQLGVQWQPEGSLFNYWSNYSIKEIQKRRFLVVNKGGKHRVLSIVRHYKSDDIGRNKNKGEANALTLLHEMPSKANAVPAEGCAVGGQEGLEPRLIEDEGVRGFGGNCQSWIAPIGKKGLYAMHSHYQFCAASAVMGGLFQRFLTGPSPEGAIRRAAFTLRKLAEADPKTTARGEKELLRLMSCEFESTVEELQNDLEVASTAKEEYDLVLAAQSSENALPSIWLGPLQVAIRAEKAYGPNPRTWAVCIQTGGSKTGAEENQENFTNAWNELSE
jgi:hypothetical protein